MSLLGSRPLQSVFKATLSSRKQALELKLTVGMGIINIVRSLSAGNLGAEASNFSSALDPRLASTRLHPNRLMESRAMESSKTADLHQGRNRVVGRVIQAFRVG